jgi:branched-chain amino acid transport system ATP-binding protein
MSQPLLKVQGVEAFYGNIRALGGVDVDVNEGEIVCLIGANGAGKSTLLRALAGALDTPRDAIELDGQAAGAADERRQLARGIALVPEGRRLFPSLSVLENLQLAARNGRRGRWTVERLLRDIPLLDAVRDRPATALSGGQQQIVALSRALVMNPSYLLFDEVSLGLSPAAVDDVYRLIGTVKAEGVAIVLVEQNVRRALAESQRFYCIQKGRIALEGASAGADYAQVTQAYFGA